MKRLLLLFVILLSSTAAFAGIAQGSKIDEVWGYDDFGGGDVIVRLDTGVSECPTGLWLSPNQPGFQTVLSMVLLAYSSQKPVAFQIREQEIWPGSSEPHCRLRNIMLK
ncbi:hypothetical protein EYS14_20745 [Alteromonadaceae bacterium M269]|nr:hypothetical protein EYS14_20745 [Alteromonadaceae bacterium M269]